MEPLTSAIVALGKRTRAICDKEHLLWVIPEDHKRLRDKTMGHALVMGRKTYESIGKPLKGRVNVIVTTQADYDPKIPVDFDVDLVKVATSVDQAIRIAKEEEKKKNPSSGEIFIFGGGQIYQQTIQLMDRLYLTLVDSDEEGTSKFPEYENLFTKIIDQSAMQTSHDKVTGKELKFQWVDLER